ncbi:MAG: bifunctional isocitrate dehydrogenase kinase/phosphatase [Anaerolineae bacterium]
MSLSDSRLANLSARAILDGFETYQNEFRRITECAKQRFETRDWAGMQTDAAERLQLYKRVVDPTVDGVLDLLGERPNQKLIWASMKAVYSGLITNLDNWELAETFFNSITRRIFATVGVDQQIEFVDTDFETPPTPTREPVYCAYKRASSTAVLIQKILTDFKFSADYAHLAQDAILVAERIEAQLKKIGALQVVERVEMVDAVFYRGKAAYLIGRMFSGSHFIPLGIALLHHEEGIIVDAVLLEEDDLSILFSFAYSYFHVLAARPYDLVHFLRTIVPRKRRGELYISLGYNKHGKTEMYRGLLHYIDTSDDCFEIARGEKGMVMTVFTLPGYDLVFKIIKDRFAPPKNSTRQDVKAKYKMVFNRDRVGRLVDAQEFEHLKFSRARFTDELLTELQKKAAGTVTLNGENVVVNHAYVERRVIPLNIFVKEADAMAARAAVVDYGRAVKDMAASNIFAGDLLLKNFGVTRHGRVVFYDYDELSYLTDCNFRAIPQSPYEEDDFLDQPWFTPNDEDIFPEEFCSFLGLFGELRRVFEAYHADLFDVEFWQTMQTKHRAGEIIHFYPYRLSRRLNHR